jgi:hypothetical protein
LFSEVYYGIKIKWKEGCELENKEVKNIFNNKPFTLIPNIFVKSVDGEDCMLNEKQLAISSVVYMSRTSKDVCIFSINSICDSLGLAYNSRIKKIIIDTLQLLQDEEELHFKNKIYLNDEYVIKDLNKLKANDIVYGQLIEHMDGDYCMFCDLDIDKLVNYSLNNEVDLYSLIKQYIYICSCINKDDKCEDYLCAYPKLDTIASECNIKSRNTVVKYNNIFKELKIFSFDYAGYKIDKNGNETIRNGNMFYTICGNEEILLERLRKDREKHGYYKVSTKYKELINLQISLSKKITNINKLENKTIIDLERLKLLEQEKEKIIQLIKEEK